MKSIEFVNQPLVSVGMPTYNRPDSLRKALEGIVNQTYKNLEIIVSDNASPDPQVDEILRDFASRDLRVKHTRQSENIGAAANFAYVLLQSTGSLYMWAADDDWRAETFIEELVKQHLENPSASIAFSNFMAIDEQGGRVVSYPEFLPKIQSLISEYRIVRQLRYFLQKEHFGKANLVYGLMKKSYMESFDRKNFSSYGGDMHFVYFMLGKGDLSISNKLLYKCTVGNVKNYSDSKSNKEKKLKIVGKIATQNFNYLITYLSLSSIFMALILITLLPLKFIQLNWIAIIKPVLVKMFSKIQ